MNIKRAAATFGAALILTGSPAFAADTQSGPIHIERVTAYGGNTTNGNGENVYTPGSTGIVFTNRYDFPATEVVFALETRGYVLDHFDDVGTFATGVMISHTFGESQIDSAMRVAVEKAKFADGTVWVNPDVPQVVQADTTVGVPVRGPF
jgi:hypothetical protein